MEENLKAFFDLDTKFG